MFKVLNFSPNNFTKYENLISLLSFDWGTWGRCFEKKPLADTMDKVLRGASFCGAVETLNFIIPTERGKIFISWVMDLKLLSVAISFPLVSMMSVTVAGRTERRHTSRGYTNCRGQHLRRKLPDLQMGTDL